MPTIILVGGPMTVEDGTQLDSRQAVRGDGPSEVTNKSLASSLIWWTLTSSLVERLLEAIPNPDAFAMVIGSRTVVEVRPDDSFRRTRLTSLLRANAGKVRIARAFDGEPLPAGFRICSTESSPYDGEVSQTLGFCFVGDKVRWRFFEGNPYYLSKAGPSIGASVVIDTSQSFAMDGTPGSEWFSGFDAQRLYDPNLILVMPHTAARERLLRGYLNWVQGGRQLVPTRFGRTHAYEPAAPLNPLNYSVAVPIAADFGVTALIRNAEWTDGAELEAARKLLERRFDLRLGIWDLVDNPTMRSTLLTVESPKRVITRRVRVPASAGRRAEKEVAIRGALRQADAEAREKVMEILQPLVLAGWERLDQRGYYRYPLTPAVESWPNQPPGPLGWLALQVVRRSTKIVLRTVVYNDVKIERYIAARQSTLEAIAAPHGCSLAGMSPTLLDAVGGFGDEIDWDRRREEVAQRLPRWVDALKPLFEQAMAATDDRKATGNPVADFLTMSIQASGEVEVHDGRGPKPRIRQESPQVTDSASSRPPPIAAIERLGAPSG